MEQRRRDNRAEGQRLRQLLRYEVELWEQGITLVAGVDEAGMAPLAGPVVAGACILPHDYRPRGIDDSKQLDRAERERLAADIKAHALAWATARAEVAEIDSLNIYHAGLLALTRAVRGLCDQRPSTCWWTRASCRSSASRTPPSSTATPSRSPSPPPASWPRPPATR